jgi:hypothetical protein
VTELLGGVLITLGLFHRPAAILCMCTLLVAASVGHRGGGYLITNNPPGNEYALNLAVVCLVLALLGPGSHSLDARFFPVSRFWDILGDKSSPRVSAGASMRWRLRAKFSVQAGCFFRSIIGFMKANRFVFAAISLLFRPFSRRDCD